ncbi:hypothetical protein [Parahaliea mediterranea]|uniref:hypothetical protein n=1 Tax=Parahaliea mediterranea TaxID=651086 RepID=UPI001300B64A|nr:hypothetical protein [Parahaliea mediterranea]
MRIILAGLFSLAASAQATAAQADPAQACGNLDMNDPAAILACLAADASEFNARTKAQFDPNQKCALMQYRVVQVATTALDPKAGRRVNSRTLADPNVDRPSCETLSEVVELIHGRPAAWSPCLGYDEAEDKFEHFTYCLPKYQQLRYGRAKATVGMMTCKRATATYQAALGYIYPPRTDQGDYLGRPLPATYVAPDCAEVDAFFKASHAVELAELEAQHQQQMKLKAERKAEAQKKAKEQALRAKKTQEMYARIEEDYQLGFEELNAQSLASLNSAEHPTDTIDNTQIRHALVKEIWALMPQSQHEGNGIKARLVHSSAGFFTWTNNPMAPNVYHAVKDVAIERCDVQDGRAHCRYTATVSSSIDYPGMQNAQQRQVYSKLGDVAGGGPRSLAMESDFYHDGQQWRAKLSYEQAKQLLPPNAKHDANQAAKEREKMNCDIMSAMGVPVLC